MLGKRVVELLVGLFIIFGAIALLLLALRVSGFSGHSFKHAYKISAEFDNIGDLKVRAPVKVAGVRIGEVSAIQLDKKNFRARVTMLLANGKDNLPIDSSASILSASLLGSNYVAINPGFEKQTLKNDGKITETHAAVILENLLGQAIFKPK